MTLAPPSNPASAHLSADVVLRFLAAVHRRARALAPDDVLTGALAKVWSEWPLTGALADATDGPLTPPTFGVHPGLSLRYAEWLASRPKPARVSEPTSGFSLSRGASNDASWTLRTNGRPHSELASGVTSDGVGLRPVNPSLLLRRRAIPSRLGSVRPRQWARRPGTPCQAIWVSHRLSPDRPRVPSWTCARVPRDG